MWYRSWGQVTGGSTTLDGHTDRPMAILREVPTEALAQPDAAAALSPEPGLVVLTSRGIPEVGAWRR